ncbi:MAG: M23 family metallopeptidase [Candidatus Peribacteraceae bacterium]|nr:M23 family metallopeptidase [Candidatus Peribacteraceae bacterium]
MRPPRVLAIAKQKLSFMVASMSLLAFVMGNMVGQNGWYAFWKTVLGAEDDSTIMFVGTVSPIAKIPDYEQWAKYGGSKQLHTFNQVPKDVLRDLPVYDVAAITGSEQTLAKQAYSTMWAGGYNTVQGSHAGVDIDAPRGTPIVSIANGIVQKVSMQKNGFGHHVLIRHPNVPDASAPGGTTTLYSTYAHMDAVLVAEGMIVHKGQSIGTVGNTGLVFGATGYHLYFQINKADAPYHPYWPFTSTEIAADGMSFVQAVDSTKYQDRLFQYTIDPMAFVEKYDTYVPRAVIAQGQTSSSRISIPASATPAERLKLAAAQRGRERMAKAGITVVASSSSSREVVAAVSSSSVPAAISDTSSSSVASSAQPEPIVEVVKTASIEEPTERPGTVDHLTIQHSGKLSHTWQKVTIRAVDRNGDIVKSPSFGGRLYIIPEFGEATIRPAELSPLDFVDGVATVNVLSRSTKTLFIATRGAFTTVSAPMINDK